MTDYKELAILGLLKEGPKHGYQIKKLLKNVLRVFTTIDSKSIYYPLKTLKDKGFLEERVTRQGNRPQRYEYRLTLKGEDYFDSLLLSNFLGLSRPFVNVDLSLYFYPYIDVNKSMRRLKVRLRALERVKRWILKNIEQDVYSLKPYLKMILKHNLKLVEAEIDFTNELLEKKFDLTKE